MLTRACPLLAASATTFSVPLRLPPRLPWPPPALSLCGPTALPLLLPPLQREKAEEAAAEAEALTAEERDAMERERAATAAHENKKSGALKRGMKGYGGGSNLQASVMGRGRGRGKGRLSRAQSAVGAVLAPDFTTIDMSQEEAPAVNGE
jgi:hypothetical protein